MTFDPRHVGFLWPHDTQLANIRGETMNIRPFAANIQGVQVAGNKRVAQRFRYYGSDSRILTELEVLYWFAGGQQTVLNFFPEFRRCFERHGASRLALSMILAELGAKGFNPITTIVCLGWLVQDSYVGLECSKVDWVVELLNW